MKVIHLGNNAPKINLPGELGSDPVLAPDQTPFDTYIEIHVAPTSSLIEAVAEIKTVVAIQSHNAIPEWIGYNDEASALATVLNAEFGGAVEMRVIA